MKQKNLRMIRAAVVQVNATRDWKRNLARIEPLLKRALRAEADLIALPEAFAWRGPHSEMREQARDVLPLILDKFRKFCAEHQTAVHLGSVIEPSNRKNKYYNTSFLINDSGRVSARYRKIHLFDVSIKGKVKTRESRNILHGDRAVTTEIDGVKAGLSICYDVRFPELYRKQSRAGAQILFVPANFTAETGRHHWEVLLRARAIENQAFVIAAGQVGRHPSNKIMSYGNSMIIDPWGKILKRGSFKKEEVLVADLNLSYQNRLRKELPALRHRRLT